MLVLMPYTITCAGTLMTEVTCFPLSSSSDMVISSHTCREGRRRGEVQPLNYFSPHPSNSPRLRRERSNVLTRATGPETSKRTAQHTTLPRSCNTGSHTIKHYITHYEHYHWVTENITSSIYYRVSCVHKVIS